MSAADVIAEYHSGTRLVANLREGNGNALSGEMVSFTVNGKKWEFATNANGVVRFSTDRFGVGNYTVFVSYGGNELYSPSSTTANINIYEKLNTTISVAYNVGSKQLVATLSDAEGNAIGGADLVITLEGVDYILSTDSEGQVMFSTQYLDLGRYTFNVSYAGDTYYYPTSKTASIIIQ